MDLCLVWADARRNYVSQFKADQLVIGGQEAMRATSQLLWGRPNIANRQMPVARLPAPISNRRETIDGDINPHRGTRSVDAIQLKSI